MKRTLLLLLAALALAFLLPAPTAGAQELDAFYNATTGNATAATGVADSIKIDTRSKNVSLYINGTDGTADGTFRVECAYFNSTHDYDWGACSGDYTIAGQTQISLSVANSNFERVRIVTLNAGSVTGHFTLETR